MRLPHFKIGRTAACILVVVLVFGLYELQLFNWQIINGETYEKEALSNRTDAIEINAVRGEILDRDGNVMSGNHIVYEVIYNALYLEDDKRNATILEVIDLLEERGEKWRDQLPIELDAEGNYRFKEGQEEEIEKLKDRDMLNLADYATADDCMNELAKRYRYQGFSKEDTRTVMSVRYSMTQDGFSINNPYVIATGVSAETVGVFGERAGQWAGIETRVGAQRYYGEAGRIAPHIIGNIGTIQDYFWEQAEKDGLLYDAEENISGYKTGDIVGRSGAEYAFEKELRGQRGLESVFTNENGEVTSTALAIQPQQGNTVQLTLDSNLQRVANMSLEKNIKENSGGGDKAHNCRNGAVVAISIEDFGVLASSSYPTYDIERYSTDSEYSNAANNDNENQPLLNRALQGAYTPGSVFKPLVAIAGLQEGVVSAGQGLYNCEGMFDYEDMHMRCTGWHHYANVYEAISGSCNCYFAELGLKLGIRRLGPYAEYFGLGEETGVELSERVGTMSNPQEYQELHTGLGETWTDGITAQAAIGQADDMFTPIQLATYCAALANGGKRYRTHFLQQVLDYSREELVRRYEPELLYDAEISGDVQGVVREAMVQTATVGTAKSVFADYPVAVACKTGTAETSALKYEEGGTEENISFICYAPANDPQIAIAVMLEHGRGGPYAMNVAKDILDQYFGFYTWDAQGNKYDQEGNLVDDSGKILKTKEELDEEAAGATPQPSPSATPSGEGQENGGERENGEGGQEGQASQEPTPTPSPTPSPTPMPDRGKDIPDHIFTGAIPEPAPNEEGPEDSQAPAPDATPQRTPDPGGDGPYYSGGAASPSPNPEDGAGPESGPEAGDG